MDTAIRYCGCLSVRTPLSVDSLRILFVTAAGEVLIYDAQGKRVGAMTLPEGTEITKQSGGGGAMSPTGGGNKQLSGSRDEKDGDDDDDDSEDEMKAGEGKEAGGGGGGGGRLGKGGGGGGKGRVIFVDWYDGAEGLLHPQVPTLCIALDGGFVQLSRGVDDDASPLVVNAHMTIRQASQHNVLFLGRYADTGVRRYTFTRRNCSGHWKHRLPTHISRGRCATTLPQS